MRLAKYMLAAAAASLAVAPAMAAPVNPAASLSVSRAAAPSADKSDLFRGRGFIVAAFALAAIIAGIIIIADNDDDSDSN